MPKIKWLGKIDDPEKYQKGKLSPKAKKMKQPARSGKHLFTVLLFVIIPCAILLSSATLKILITNQFTFSPLHFLLGFVLGYAATFLHELLHAIVYPQDATVYIGIPPKARSAVALASYPLKKSKFIVMSLLPAIIGLLPLIIFSFLPSALGAVNSFLFAFAAVGLVTPYADYYIAYRVLSQTPKNCKIQYYGEDLYWIG